MNVFCTKTLLVLPSQLAPSCSGMAVPTCAVLGPGNERGDPNMAAKDCAAAAG